MNSDAPSLMAAIADHVAFIKIVGRANFTLGVPFKTLISNLRQQGFKDFVVDLTECGTMDSTFLGVLAGVVLNPSDITPRAEAACLRLLNPNQRVSDLLENLGIAHLFTMVSGQNPAESALAPSSQSEVTASREVVTKTCLEAHQLLMKVNPENVPKFKEVTQFLAEDLKKLSSKDAT